MFYIMQNLNSFLLERLKLTKNSKINNNIIDFDKLSKLLENDERITEWVPIERDVEIEPTIFYTLHDFDDNVLAYCYCVYKTDEETAYATGRYEYYQLVISREKNNQISVFVGWTNENGTPIDGMEHYILKQHPTLLTTNQYEKLIEFIIEIFSDWDEVDFNDPSGNYVKDFLQFLEEKEHTI